MPAPDHADKAERSAIVAWEQADVSRHATATRRASQDQRRWQLRGQGESTSSASTHARANDPASASQRLSCYVYPIVWCGWPTCTVSWSASYAMGSRAADPRTILCGACRSGFALALTRRPMVAEMPPSPNPSTGSDALELAIAGSLASRICLATPSLWTLPRPEPVRVMAIASPRLWQQRGRQRRLQ
jgi:hypothetical protein